MSSQQDRDRSDSTPDLARSARPLTDVETARIEDEARERTLSSSEQVAEGRRRGRVEAETHRVSEEMTHRAQEQLLEQQRLMQGPPPATAIAAPPAVPELTPARGLGRALPEPYAINRVLVPLSSEMFAERALPYALSLVQLTGASLAIAHVGEPPLPDPPATIKHIAQPFLPTDALARILDRTAVFHIPSGSVSHGLLGLEVADVSDIVVLALRRRPGTEGDTLGNVAQALIRQGHAPVLLIPPGATVPTSTLPQVARFLVPLDGSALAEQVLAPVMGLATSSTGETAPHEALREIVLYSAFDSWITKDDTTRYLDSVRQALRPSLPASIQISTEVHLGSAGGAIVAMAEHGAETATEQHTPFDLVALATHGRSGVTRWLLGSVAEYVATHSTVPVLLLRPEHVDA